VLVTGGTGVLGRAAVPRLLAAGHEIVVATRSDTSAAAVDAMGARPRAVDLFDAASVRAALDGCDAIAHLATNVPPMRQMRKPDAWATHNRLRVDAARHLLDAARDAGITRVVKESITFTYPDCSDRWIDEDTPIEGVAPLLEPTVVGDRMVLDFVAEGREGVLLRFGFFYSAAARSTDEYLQVARLHLSPVSGSPDAYVSSIHVDDAAEAVVHALDAPSGVYNIVDDEPLTRRAYTDAFATAFGLGRLVLAPAWMLRAVVGRSSSALTSSQRVANARAKDALGWTPQYVDARRGWVAVAAARQAGARDTRGGAT
jgi:nucleoside-diphosphate-sugar epimerase